MSTDEGKGRKGKQRPRTVRVERELWPTLGITESQYQQLIKVLEAKGRIVRQEQTPIVNMSGKFDKEVILHARPFGTLIGTSRATWVYLLKQKHEASMCLKAFHKMVKVQFEKNIRRIRCDNGGEFISNQMIKFYANQGIILETSCIHTPQQNDVVECKHKHLLETARALRFEANLPIRFWGECILTAAHVEEEEIFIPPSIWDDEVIEEKPKDLNGEPNETEIGHGEPIEEFEDDFEHYTQTEAPSEDQTEADVGPEGSQDEDNHFRPTEEPIFNSDSNKFVEP
ncbi:putative RNA-directed DNA polymerase [Tanacetum coccineum]